MDRSLFHFVERNKGKIRKSVQIWAKTLSEAKKIAEMNRDYSSSVISIESPLGYGCYAYKKNQQDWVDVLTQSLLEAKPGDSNEH